MSEPLTDRQAAVMVFIQEFYDQEDRLPSTREIQSHFGFASQTGAMGHLRALARKGMIEHRGCARNDRQWWRFVRPNRPIPAPPPPAGPAQFSPRAG